jgi:hypothetical protein
MMPAGKSLRDVLMRAALDDEACSQATAFAGVRGLKAEAGPVHPA